MIITHQDQDNRDNRRLQLCQQIQQMKEIRTDWKRGLQPDRNRVGDRE